MKWREGNTGRWAFAQKFTGRKAGVTAVVTQHTALARKLDLYSFMLRRGDDAYNSLWHAPAFNTPEEAMQEAERAISEGYPHPRNT